MNWLKRIFPINTDKVIKADPLYIKGYEAGRIAERGACVIECYRQKANSARMTEVLAIDRCVAAIKSRDDK